MNINSVGLRMASIAAVHEDPIDPARQKDAEDAVEKDYNWQKDMADAYNAWLAANPNASQNEKMWKLLTYSQGYVSPINDYLSKRVYGINVSRSDKMLLALDPVTDFDMYVDRIRAWIAQGGVGQVPGPEKRDWQDVYNVG